MASSDERVFHDIEVGKALATALGFDPTELRSLTIEVGPAGRISVRAEHIPTRAQLDAATQVLANAEDIATG